MLTTNNDESITLSNRRQDVLLETAYELDALANLLPIVVPNGEKFMEQHLAIRGFAGRIKTLASVLMSGLSDEAEKTEELERSVMIAASTGADKLKNNQ